MKPYLVLLVVALAGCATGPSPLKPELDQMAARQAELSKESRTLIVIGHNVRHPNSAGGVDFVFTFQSVSPKVIKYARVTVTPFNRVGDQAYSQIGRRSTVELEATGPFPTNFAREMRWANVWYNNTINFARIDEISLEYMDGTVAKVSGEALAAVQIRPENNVFAARVQQTREFGLSADGRMSIFVREL